MPFFQNLIDRAKEKIKGSYDKRQEEKEFEEKLRREQRLLERIELERELKVQALEVAKIKAKKDAERLTGLGKLRAIKRVQNLEENKKPALGRFSEYINRNLARREKNMKNTKQIREEVGRMKEEKSQQRNLGAGFKRPFTR